MANLDAPARDAALAQLARRYGFRAASASSALAGSEAASAARVEASLEAMSEMLSLACDLPMERARKLCGLGGRAELRLRDPSEMPEDVLAVFDPKSFAICVSGQARPDGAPAATLFGHEWAHALDFALGAIAPDPSARSVGVSGEDGLLQVARASHAAAPYQAVLGAIAAGREHGTRGARDYASLQVARGSGSPLPAFSRVVRSMLPGLAKSIRNPQRAAREIESRSQLSRLAGLAEESAFEALEGDAEIAALSLPTSQIRAAARFCSKAVLASSRRESARRRGRESAIDEAKTHIAQWLRGALRLPDESCERLASSVFHISGLKDAHADDFFAAPYSGRSTWVGAGSLADLSCALVRVSRNQRALSNSRLAKEKFVPMAFWWSMRRHVSQHASEIGARADAIIGHMVDAGAVSSQVLEHARQWGGERREYKAGALVFSDLVGTGAKMIREEAAMAGREITERESRALRRRIVAPIDEMARRDAVREGFAESFEQFVAREAGMRTRLGKACQRALQLGLVESDAGEVAASLDPSVSWMHSKDGDPEGNAKRWRSLLRDVPALFAQAPRRARSPRSP